MEQRNNLAVLQARMSSKRLPGKVLMEINGQPMIYWQIQRIFQSKEISKLVVATTDFPTDDVLVKYLQSISCDFVRGPLDDVLARFVQVENIYSPDTIVRLTADCPLVMPKLIDSMLKKSYELKVQYLSNIIELTYPDGLDIEVIKAGTLSKLLAMNPLRNEREHVTLGIMNRMDQFSCFNVANLSDLSSYRWTVDTKDDLDFVRGVFKAFTSRETEFDFEDLMNYFKTYPHLNRLKHR
jgi:spore coat polysaccharide biosynthesis protein SpsF (cytidylyltransferase family)